MDYSRALTHRGRVITNYFNPFKWHNRLSLLSKYLSIYPQSFEHIVWFLFACNELLQLLEMTCPNLCFISIIFGEVEL